MKSKTDHYLIKNGTSSITKPQFYVSRRGHREASIVSAPRRSLGE